MRREPYKVVPFETLLGETITAVEGLENGSLEVLFMCASGRKFRMDHCQDCCEDVCLEDVVGDVDDILNTPILLAELSYEDRDVSYGDSMWSFYKLHTVKGDITILWLGSSNGYYSISVDFEEIVLPHEWR